MKLVDINSIKTKAKYYTLVKELMPILYSEKELDDYCPSAIKVRSFEELLSLLREKDIYPKSLVYYNAESFSYNVSVHNIYIKTVDEYKPDTIDMKGNITFYLDENGNKISVDSCWVKLYYILYTLSKIFLYTSSGVYIASILTWDISAGTKAQYMYGKSIYLTNTPEERKMVFWRHINKSKVSVSMYKFVMAFFTPGTPTFLDLDKAAAYAFSRTVKAKDRKLILFSKTFKKAAMDLLKLYQPELKDKIKETFDPKTLVEMLSKAYEIGVETKKVRDILDIFNEIKDIAYVEEPIEKKPLGLPPADELDKLMEKSVKELSDLTDELDYPKSYITGVDGDGQLEDEDRI